VCVAACVVACVVKGQGSYMGASYCGVLPCVGCVAVCCGILQRVAECCSALLRRGRGSTWKRHVKFVYETCRTYELHAKKSQDAFRKKSQNISSNNHSMY